MTTATRKRPVLGRTEPRLFTPPRRKLSRATSYGYAVCDFAADVLGEPFDPWERWLVIHAGELLPDGRPRFRKVLVLVARQNGKTHVLKVLALYWLYVEHKRLVLGTSTNLDYAREAWAKAVADVERIPELADRLDTSKKDKGIRLANGEQELRTADQCRYKIAAANRRGGRSLTIDRLVIDELREHHDWSAWAAAVPATNAVRDAQVFAITNQGDDASVVLDSLRDDALAALDGDSLDDRLGIFEWSAPDGCELDDVDALRQANPNLGHRLDVEDLLADARRAQRAGGDEEAVYRTEVLCQRVHKMSAAIDQLAWMAGRVEGSLDGLRGRVVACVDVAPDGQHATLVAAAAGDDGRVRVEAVRSWTDTAALRKDLPALVARIKPKMLGWFPFGPAAALAADLRDRPDRRDWPPRGVEMSELKGDTAAVCMGFAEQVAAGQVLHSGDPLLDAHVAAASKLRQGDRWSFSRKSGGHVDACYAAAGAVHLARTVPVSLAKPRLLIAR